MELLAPAGTPASLYAAVAAGADAVYFGLGELNARAKAQGFDENNVKDLIDYCHLHKVKVHVTLNTMVKNGEKDEFVRLADIAAKAGVDAFIVADIGAARLLSHLDVPLHASTQMGVHNLEGAKYLERYGFTRVVVARETLLEDVRRIKSNTSLEVEYFVHGALCVAFSGACLASAFRSGDSGNRGRCLQPCRLKYQSQWGKSGYLLSTADQCLLCRLDELRDAGVDSLKIEGRLKQPHYVYETVSAYRSALDGAKPAERDKDGLKRAFNRGNFSEGYNFCDTDRLMYPKVQNNIGVSIGTVVAARAGNATVRLRESINVGDGLKLLDKDGREKGGFEARCAVAQSECAKIDMPHTVQAATGDVLAKTFDAQLASKAVTSPVALPVTLSAKAVVGEPFTVTASRGEVSFSASGNNVQTAGARPLDKTSLTAALDRLGGSGLSADRIVVECGENAFVPLSEINRVRREACDGLKAALLAAYRKTQQRAKTRVPYAPEMTRLDELYEVGDLADADCEAAALALCPSDFSPSGAERTKAWCEASGKKIYCHLPTVARGDDVKVLRRWLGIVNDVLCGYICDNWYALELAREYGKTAVAGCRLNICSDDAFFASGANVAIASAEISYPEYRALGFDALCYAVGEPTIMTLTHCPVQLNTGCTCRNCKYDGDFTYSDKAATYRISRTRLAHCTFDLHNPSVVCVPPKYRQGTKPFVSLVGTGLRLSDYFADPYMKGANKTAGLLARGVK